MSRGRLPPGKSRGKSQRGMGLSEKRVRRATAQLSRHASGRVHYFGRDAYPLNPERYAPILATLQKQLRGLRGRRILEIGPGGPTSFLEECMRQGAEVSGLDRNMSPDHIEAARRRGIPIEKRGVESHSLPLPVAC